MGKLSEEDKATLARLEKLRDAPDEDDDDRDYVWVRTEAGHTVRLHGDRARAYCRRNGIDLDDAEDSSRENPVEAPKAGAKKAAPKKAGAPKAGAPAEGDGAELDEGDGAELDTDPPARSRPRQFF